MKLIIGLGNPGEKYQATRHNVGFMIIDQLQKKWNFPDFEFGKKFDASLSKGKFEDQEILLAKPETFMNLSGQAVKNILEFYKLFPEDILVVHDDLDVTLGKFKETSDSRSAGHNGVQNIIDMLGTQEFRRLRIGIKPEECIFDASSFVLQKFTDEELETINDLSESILESIEKSI